MHYAPNAIPEYAEAGIAPAFDRFALHDAKTWVQRCRDNLAQLWSCGDLWAITEVLDLKIGRVCHIVAMAGDFDHCLVSEIEGWAKSSGCKIMHFTGRKGWEKRLPDYKTIAIVRQKEIK